MAIKMKVRGIVPRLTFTNDDKTINIKTIPLAPRNPILSNRGTAMCTNPVISAVARIMIKTVRLPYRSSRIGPSNKTRVKFPVK